PPPLLAAGLPASGCRPYRLATARRARKHHPLRASPGRPSSPPSLRKYNKNG
ncbi:hypothetical protein B296_00050199, partial [Ensete ventricosum]